MSQANICGLVFNYTEKISEFYDSTNWADIYFDVIIVNSGSLGIVIGTKIDQFSVIYNTKDAPQISISFENEDGTPFKF